MPELSISLQPDQEAALRRSYDEFCRLLVTAVPASTAPDFEHFIVAKLTGDSSHLAHEMVQSIMTSGTYRHLEHWHKGQFAAFVMSLLRSLRPAGYGFVRDGACTDEDLTKGATWLLDCLEDNFGTPIPQEAREEIVQSMPQAALTVDNAFPYESINRLFTTADQYLHDCHAQFCTTEDEHLLTKGEHLIEFLSCFQEWKASSADNWRRRFRDAREAFTQRREARMTWFDRILELATERRRAANILG